MNFRLAIAVEEGSEKIYKVAQHFSRCSKFIICEINQNKEVFKKETYFNPLNGYKNGQYQLPGYIKQFEVSTIIVGRMWQKALVYFHQYGIKVIIVPEMRYDEALDLFLQNKLNTYEEYVQNTKKETKEN